MIPLPPNVIDLRGRTFGRLRVQEFIGTRNGEAYWRCACECGGSTESRGKNLIRWEKDGRAISCGCYRADPTVRKAARLQMPSEARKTAASGKPVPATERVLPVTLRLTRRLAEALAELAKRTQAETDDEQRAADQLRYALARALALRQTT